jgi:hypothetical protein
LFTGGESNERTTYAVEKLLLDGSGVGKIDARAHRQFEDGAVWISANIDHF